MITPRRRPAGAPQSQRRQHVAKKLRDLCFEASGAPPPINDRLAFRANALNARTVFRLSAA